MREEDKGKIIDLTTKYFELTHKKLFGEKDPQKVNERLEEERQAVAAESRELKIRLAKEKMMDAFAEWNMYRLDEFTKIDEEISKEIKIYEDSNPNRDPDSPYPPELDKKFKTLLEMTVKSYAITLAIQILEEEGKNWEKIIPKNRK